MYLYKKNLFLILILSIIFFILISSIIFISKSFLTTNLLESGIYPKTHYGHLSDRITKFYILKNNIKAENFILGTSSSQVIDPSYVSKFNSKETLNLAFGGSRIVENYKLSMWIIENKKNVDTLLISFNIKSFNEKFYSREPYEIQKKLINKLNNFYSLHNLRDAIKILFLKLQASSKISNINTDIYFDSGMRYYENYFLEKKNLDLKERNISIRKNNIPGIDKYFFEDKSIDYLVELKEICDKKNIKLKLFFSPVTEIFYKQQDFEYIYQEFKIIKKLVNKNLEIYYFNNFNKLNKDLSLWTGRHNHMNYDAAKLVVDDLMLNKDQYKIGVKINSKNFNLILDEFIQHTNSHKLNAIY